MLCAKFHMYVPAAVAPVTAAPATLPTATAFAALEVGLEPSSFSAALAFSLASPGTGGGFMFWIACWEINL